MNPNLSASSAGKLNVAAALQVIGILLELKGGRYFQASAYKAAARVLADINRCPAVRLSWQPFPVLVCKRSKNYRIAGPLRRWRETTPDITVVAAATHAATFRESSPTEPERGEPAIKGLGLTDAAQSLSNRIP